MFYRSGWLRCVGLISIGFWCSGSRFDVRCMLYIILYIIILYYYYYILYIILYSSFLYFPIPFLFYPSSPSLLFLSSFIILKSQSSHLSLIFHPSFKVYVSALTYTYLCSIHLIPFRWVIHILISSYILLDWCVVSKDS